MSDPRPSLRLVGARPGLTVQSSREEIAPIQDVGANPQRQSHPRFGGLFRAGLHEIYAGASDGAAATGFALAMAGQLRQSRQSPGGKSALLWVRHDLIAAEAGHIYPPGLLDFGLTPSAVTLVRAHDVTEVLQAGLEAARCSSLAAILVEFWGKSRVYDLTASRKLSLAAKASGATLFLLRHAASVFPSAAETRWRVRGLPGSPFAANTPGKPAFEITLLRRRSTQESEMENLLPGQTWSVEWNRDTASFTERGEADTRKAPLSGDLAALSPDGEVAFRQAG